MTGGKKLSAYNTLQRCNQIKIVPYTFRVVGYIGENQHQTIFRGRIEAEQGYPWSAYEAAIAVVKADEPTVRISKELPKACSLWERKQKP